MGFFSDSIVEGSLVFINHHMWDIWFHKDEIGRTYDCDRVDECLPVIVLSKRYRLAGELIPRSRPIYEVTSGRRTFWMVTRS